MGTTTTVAATARARLLVGASGALFTAGFFALTLAPSLLGLGLLLYLAYTKAVAASDFLETHIVAHRETEGTFRQGNPFVVRLASAGSHVPRGVQAHLQDLVPTTVTATAPRVAVPGQAVYEVVPQERGPLRWEAVQVHLTDRRGLWRQTRTLPRALEVAVQPQMDAPGDAALAATTDQSGRRRLLGRVTDREFESMRAYAPGDRLRDIDWKRMSQLRGLMSREWEHEQHGGLLLLLDAGRTMRARRGEVAKVDHAAQLILQLAAVGINAQLRVAFGAFDGPHVLAWQPGRADLAQLTQVMGGLAHLPAAATVRDQPDVILEGPRDADTPFFRALGPFVRPIGRGGSGIQTLVQRGQVDDIRSLYLFSDLESLPIEALSVLPGGDSTVVLLPASRFMGRPEKARLRDLENAYRERALRRRVRIVLADRGIGLIEIGPDGSVREIAGGLR